jgi:Holliday junction resolvase|tara:strand:- start:943 stop:1401 length:459 start_codon:yes stop_codon:yes gene_type:complete
MSSKSSQKGTRFEYQIRDQLTKKCGVKWDRVPMSGAGAMKGDLYCLTNHYYYCIECKSFKDSVIMENLLSAKSNNLYMWWEQCTREAETMRRQPALIFKKDRGKPLIAVAEELPELNRFSLTSDLGDTYVDVYIYLFDEWLNAKSIEELVLI